MAIPVVWAVISLSFTVDVRVVQLNLYIVKILTRLEIDTLLVIDASNVVHTNLLNRIVSNHALHRVLVRGKVAAFVTLAVLFAC